MEPDAVNDAGDDACSGRHLPLSCPWPKILDWIESFRSHLVSSRFVGMVLNSIGKRLSVDYDGSSETYCNPQANLAPLKGPDCERGMHFYGGGGGTGEGPIDEKIPKTYVLLMLRKTDCVPSHARKRRAF